MGMIPILHVTPKSVGVSDTARRNVAVYDEDFCYDETGDKGIFSK